MKMYLILSFSFKEVSFFQKVKNKKNRSMGDVLQKANFKTKNMCDPNGNVSIFYTLYFVLRKKRHA